MQVNSENEFYEITKHFIFWIDFGINKAINDTFYTISFNITYPFYNIFHDVQNIDLKRFNLELCVYFAQLNHSKHIYTVATVHLLIIFSTNTIFKGAGYLNVSPHIKNGYEFFMGV